MFELCASWLFYKVQSTTPTTRDWIYYIPLAQAFFYLQIQGPQLLLSISSQDDVY
jgi:hypothetical protein